MHVLQYFSVRTANGGVKNKLKERRDEERVKRYCVTSTQYFTPVYHK